jgi:hypothetical protein
MLLKVSSWRLGARFAEIGVPRDDGDRMFRGSGNPVTDSRRSTG